MKNKKFKPMLASQCDDISQLRYPVLVSPKLDGVRAIVIDNVLMSRSLKPIPNKFAQKMFSDLPDGTDGELILGDPTHKDVYRNTVSAVMKEDGESDLLRFWVFDNFSVNGGFEHRYSFVHKTCGGRHYGVSIVPHKEISNPSDLEIYETELLEKGYEGAMVRDIFGLYKFGRSTVKEGYLLKLKRFKDAEAVVTGVYEQMHNDNLAEKNALGRTERSTKQEGMIPAGILGGLEVRGLQGDYHNIDFRIGGGYTLEDRTEWWKIRKELIGRIVKFKYFPSGSKDKPRFPVFIGWRDERDM